MKIEHVAFMMKDPVAAAKWYCDNLGFKVKRSSTSSPFAHFLADSSGSVMIEIYNNPKATVPDYSSMDPLILHLAFYTNDVSGVRERLLKAGATAAGEVIINDNGDVVAMLRDPWSFPIQLVKRSEPMVSTS